MSQDTQAPTTIPKHLAKYLAETPEEFDRALQDEITLQCFVRYWFSLLDKLGIQRHRLRELVRPGTDALPDHHVPTAAQEDQLLQRLAEVVKERHPRFYAVYEEDLLSQLPRISYLWLSKNAGHEESRSVLHDAANKIGHKVTRQWDNPVRFVTNPLTGKRTLGDVDGRTPPTFTMRAQAFLRALEPARKLGRPKQVVKPRKSGRPPLDEDLARRVSDAFDHGMNWQAVARKVLHTQIPTDPKERDRLRHKVDRLRFKGKTLS